MNPRNLPCNSPRRILELPQVVKKGSTMPRNRAEMPLEARIDAKCIPHTTQSKIRPLKTKLPESLGNKACCVSIGR